MNRPKYKLHMEHMECELFGRWWHITVKDIDTNKVILEDSTAEDCTEQQAKEFAHRLMCRAVVNRRSDSG